MSIFDDIDIKVAGYNPLSAEEARQLYARYVKTKLALEKRVAELEEALGEIHFLTTKGTAKLFPGEVVKAVAAHAKLALNPKEK
jgi:hypothetical protein